VLEQLLARLVKADDRSSRVVRTKVDFEHILHGVHERAAVLRRNAEALL